MYIEILNTIYELMLNRIIPTKERLLSMGITEEQINYLLVNNLIIEAQPNTYKLSPVKVLFEYGKENMLQGNKRTAQDMYLLCYKIKPKHRDTCLQLFYNAVLRCDYNKAYEYLYALENVSTQEHMRKDYKIYLYLLSQVSQVPDIYQEKLEAILSDRNLITHKKPTKQQKQDNLIVSLILKGKYKFAIESLNNFLAEDFDYEVHRIIIKTLIRNIINQDDKYKKDLLDKVKHKRYREIITILEEISLTRQLRTDEESILDLTKAIIDIFENQNIPVPLPNNATNTKEAIMYFDYERALELETKFLTEKGISVDNSSIHFLLQELTKLIRNINRLNSNGITINSTLKQ